MLMLGTALIHQLKKVICQTFIAMVLKTKWLLGIIGAFLIDQMIRFVVYIKPLLAQMLLKAKVLLVRYLIIAVLLIKAGLIVVLRKVGQLGQKLATIARKILQRVKQALKLDN